MYEEKNEGVKIVSSGESVKASIRILEDCFKKSKERTNYSD